MKISTKGRYAVRLMIDIARNSGEGYVSLKDAAERQGVSLKYLEQIVTILGKGGFLSSQRGAQGGYRLTGAPDEYTVGDILKTTEGGMAPVACLEDDADECPRVCSCPTIKLWKGLYENIMGYLNSVTIADLLNRETFPCDDM